MISENTQNNHKKCNSRKWYETTVFEKTQNKKKMRNNVSYVTLKDLQIKQFKTVFNAQHNTYQSNGAVIDSFECLNGLI